MSDEEDTNSKEEKPGAHRRSLLIRLTLLIVLIITVGYLYVYASQKPDLEEPKVKIPLDEQLKNTVSESKEAQEIVRLVQKLYYNAWISNSARKNGGWPNILSLCSKELAEKIEGDKSYRDSISLGSLAGEVVSLSLDESKSRLFDLQINQETKDDAAILTDVWLKIEPESGNDYYLHQKGVLYLNKINGQWKLVDIYVHAGQENPADLSPENSPGN